VSLLLLYHNASAVSPFLTICNACSCGVMFQCLAGGTRTGAAIDEVVATGFNEQSGLRPLSEGAPRVLIVLTDGQSGDSVVQPAENVRNFNFLVLLFACCQCSTTRQRLNMISSVFAWATPTQILFEMPQQTS